MLLRPPHTPVGSPRLRMHAEAAPVTGCSLIISRTVGEFAIARRKRSQHDSGIFCRTATGASQRSRTTTPKPSAGRRRSEASEPETAMHLNSSQALELLSHVKPHAPVVDPLGHFANGGACHNAASLAQLGCFQKLV